MPNESLFGTSSRSITNAGDPWSNLYGSKYLHLSLEEKRKAYKCGNKYKTIDDLPLWSAYLKLNFTCKEKCTQYPAQTDINSKVSLWQGDITTLEVDAIVNAANQRLLAGGGVDGSIHRSAGPTLQKECSSLNGCLTGEAKITAGHCLPAKYVIHTVGPVGEKPDLLENCYRNCLQLALDFEIKTIAFCCISTGAYGYPNKDAAHVALNFTRQWLQDNLNKIERIIFCTYISKDFEIYQDLMANLYFP